MKLLMAYYSKCEFKASLLRRGEIMERHKAGKLLEILLLSIPWRWHGIRLTEWKWSYALSPRVAPFSFFCHVILFVKVKTRLQKPSPKRNDQLLWEYSNTEVTDSGSEIEIAVIFSCNYEIIIKFSGESVSIYLLRLKLVSSNQNQVIIIEFYWMIYFPRSYRDKRFETNNTMVIL